MSADYHGAKKADRFLYPLFYIIGIPALSAVAGALSRSYSALGGRVAGKPLSGY